MFWIFVEQRQQRLGNLPDELIASVGSELMGAGKKLLDQRQLVRRDRAARQSHRMARAAALNPLGPRCSAGAVSRQVESLHDYVGSRHHIAEPPSMAIEVHHKTTYNIARGRQNVGSAH